MHCNEAICVRIFGLYQSTIFFLFVCHNVRGIDFTEELSFESHFARRPIEISYLEIMTKWNIEMQSMMKWHLVHDHSLVKVFGLCWNTISFCLPWSRDTPFWLQSGNQIRSLGKRDELRPRSGQQDVTPGDMEQKRAPSCLIVMGTLVKVQLPFLSSNGASTWRPPSDSVCFWCQVLQDSGFSLLKCFFSSASCAMKCAHLDVADLQALTFL